MTEITELQQRLRDALQRIGAGIEGLEPPAAALDVDPAEIERLQEALEAEKEANAQLEERLRAQREKLERMEREQRTAVERLKTAGYLFGCSGMKGQMRRVAPLGGHSPHRKPTL